MISIRTMESAELDRLGEIDRSEEITQDYVVRDGGLVLEDVRWSVPPWMPDGEGEHSISGKIATWRPWVDEGGTMLGAFDGEALVAIAIYRPEIAPGTGQLALLHVSRPWRRQGLGAALSARVAGLARADGATWLYVSSAPTRGTVEFYRSLGFSPTREPDPDLLALEPDDIHMTVKL